MRSIALLTILLLADVLSAQCGPDGCPVEPALEPLAWHYFPDFDPDRLYLFQGASQRGSFDLKEHYYRAYDEAADAWGQPIEMSPLPVPPHYLQPPGGVDRERISPIERVTANGRPISMAQAHALIGAGLPADADWLRLTIIGTDADRQRVLDDLNNDATLKELRGKLVVQDYPPEHWAVAGAGFHTAGTPTIYLQQPDGKVLHRQDSYHGPAELSTAIRRADPDYDKERDPNLLEPSPLRPGSWPPYIWLIVGAATLYILSRKEQE